MYNDESYEEYIRSILGYPNYNNSHFEDAQYYPDNYPDYELNSELEDCYPEIYKVVYPMVTKACNMNVKPINSALIDELTEEIYASIETENEVKININLTNQTSASSNNRNTPSSNNNAKKEEKRGEDRQIRNNSLKDLIRILLIRELLGNRPNRPNRPNHPPFGRPPFDRPQFPGMNGGPRPPIMPRDLY